MTTEALTYKELASRLGVKLESARKTVLRKRWKRVTGNDGTVRIHVPVESLPSRNDSHGDSPSDSRSDTHIRELEVMIESLKSIVETEKRRADSAELDRDRWHELATKPWWKRLVA